MRVDVLWPKGLEAELTRLQRQRADEFGPDKRG